MFYATLSDRSVIALSGQDTIPFLQGLITNDAALLENGTPLYAALLSPQGRFLHDFFLIPQQGRILLDVDSSRAADLLARLKVYKLRSKVTIEPQPQRAVTALWDGTTAENESTIRDPRLPELGYRHYAETPLAATAEAGDYERHRIALGIPDGTKDMIFDKSLLLEFAFESLHGVSFSKGCYVGQEVTARSKFRGQLRKRLYTVRADAPLPASGTKVMGGETEVGELKSVSGTGGLAVLRSEDAHKADTLTANGVALRYAIPEWDRSIAD